MFIDRTEPASPAPTLAELELRRAPESDDFDVDMEEEETDEEEEIVGSSGSRAMKPFGVEGARATPSAAARAQLRSSFSTSTPPSTELTVAGFRTNNPKVAKRPARSTSSSIF